ncbi:MAG: hypothetical protein AAFP23_05585, partial [Pseudomonadota bacterium]
MDLRRSHYDTAPRQVVGRERIDPGLKVARGVAAEDDGGKVRRRDPTDIGRAIDDGDTRLGLEGQARPVVPLPLLRPLQPLHIHRHGSPFQSLLLLCDNIVGALFKGAERPRAGRLVPARASRQRGWRFSASQVTPPSMN